VKLELNTIGTAASRQTYKQVLVEYFDKHRASLDEDSLRRLERNPLRILDSKNPALRELIDDAPLLSGYLDDESRAHFERVQILLGDIGIGFTLNPRLVRGLDYYSRTVFEWLTDRLGAQGAICSGGRYDGLVEALGGRATAAVGWALGMERVVELMQAEGIVASEPPPDAYLIASGDAERRYGFKLAEELRGRVPGLKLSLGGPAAGFKAQLRRADRSGARVALIVGEAERTAGKVSFKPLREEDPQLLVGLDECAALLRQLRASA
jgi:histidyl-tRNA synthetase